MERNEISRHEVFVYRALAGHNGWLSNTDLDALVPTISKRTIRAKTKKLADLGLVDVAEVFPGHRYRWSDMAKQRNSSYLLRLQQADAVFGP